MSSTACPNRPVAVGPWDAMTGWNSTILAAADCLQGCASAYAGWQEEAARFVEMRLAENQRAWAALLSSRDAVDVVRTQQEWALKTAADYAAEARRVARLGTTLCLTGTTPAVQGTAALLG